MCFEFSSCFGGGIKDDYGGERSKHGGCGGRRRGRKGDRGAADHQPAIDEAGRKAYHDGAWKADHASAGGHGYYAAYAQEKAHETPKLPAWQNKVGDGTGYAYNTAHLHPAASDPREHGAMDQHHYPSTTTTLVRY